MLTFFSTWTGDKSVTKSLQGSYPACFERECKTGPSLYAHALHYILFKDPDVYVLDGYRDIPGMHLTKVRM